MKKKHVKQIPPIPNTSPHNIPLNLYHRMLPNPAHIPPAVNPYATAPNFQMLHPMLFNPLMYYWPMGYMGQLPPHYEHEMQSAATKIQKLFRGYRVRKQFRSLTLNPIVEQKNPTLYYVEKMIYDIARDWILDGLTDVSQEVYLPLSNTKELKARRILNDAVKGLIHQVHVEFKNPSGVSEKSAHESYFDELLCDFIRETANEHVHEVCTEYIINESLQPAFDYILEGYIKEELFPMLFEMEVNTMFVNCVTEVLKHEIRYTALEVTAEKRVQLYMRKPVPPTTIDNEMQKIIDFFLVQELLLELSTSNPPNFQQELDSCLLACLVELVHE